MYLIGGVDRYGRKNAKQEVDKYHDDGNHQDRNKMKKSADFESKLERLNKLARGEISGSSSSSDDDVHDRPDGDSESDEERGDDVETESNEAEANPLSIPGDDITYCEEGSRQILSNRLAIQNCDWENLTSEDIL
jgi:hypothetical protein